MQIWRWFGFRIAIILIACAVSYYTINIYVQTKLQQSITTLTFSLAWFIGLLATRKQYVNLPTKPEPLEQPIPSLKDLMPQLQVGSNPAENCDPQPLIREVETHSLASPKKKTSFDDLINQKILQSLANADVNINVTVERQGKKWNVTRAKSKIKTRKKQQTVNKPIRRRPA